MTPAARVIPTITAVLNLLLGAVVVVEGIISGARRISLNFRILPNNSGSLLSLFLRIKS